MKSLFLKLNEISGENENFIPKVSGLLIIEKIQQKD